MRKITALMLLWVAMSNSAHAQTYQYYYGTLHSHSSYSDGNRDEAQSGIATPAQSFAYAKGSYHFDFLGISDHNHSQAGMHHADYAKGLYQADTSTKDGTFVALFGMEYGTLSNGGHILVYGMDSLIGWEPDNYDIYNDVLDYGNLFRIIARHPRAFGSFAHPDNSDFSDLVNTAYNPAADSAMGGTAVRNGGAFSETTDYSDGVPATVYFSYYRKLLAKGYHVGPAIDHDNHYSTFGRTTKSRTVVLSRQLSKDSILAAYAAMRFYASDDWNTKVSFTIDGHPMGSVFSTQGTAEMQVVVSDPDIEDTTASIIVHYGVPGSDKNSTYFTTIKSLDTFHIGIDNGLNTTYYYFLEITQKDGDKIWTSPIWVTRAEGTLPLYALHLDGKQQGTGITLTASLSASPEFRYFTWQKGYTGSDFADIGLPVDSICAIATFSYIDMHPTSGWQYYRLKITEPSGTVQYSNVTAVNYTDKSFQLISLAPNPVISTLYLTIHAARSAEAAYSIYNAEGRLVGTKVLKVTAGESTCSINTSTLPTGAYIITFATPTGILESKFLKVR